MSAVIPVRVTVKSQKFHFLYDIVLYNIFYALSPTPQFHNPKTLGGRSYSKHNVGILKPQFPSKDTKLKRWRKDVYVDTKNVNYGPPHLTVLFTQKCYITSFIW